MGQGDDYMHNKLFTLLIAALAMILCTPHAMSLSYNRFETDCTDLPSAAAYLSVGIEQAHQQNFADAVMLYDCAISIEADETRAYLLRASSYYGMRSLDSALTDLEVVIESPTAIPFVRFSAYGLKGEITYALGEYDSSAASFESAIEIGRDSVSDFGDLGVDLTSRFLVERAALYLDLNQFHLAYIDLVEALQIKPDNAIAHAELGILYQQTGDTAGFIDSIRTANDLDPNVADAFAQLGNLLYDVGDYRRSLIYLSYALQIRPRPQLADYIRRARTASDYGQCEIAISDYSAAIDLEPHASMYFYRGMCYYNTGDYVSALTDLETAQGLESRDGAVYLYLGHTYYALGRLEEAKQNYEVYLTPVGRPTENDAEIIDRLNEINAALGDS